MADNKVVFDLLLKDGFSRALGDATKKTKDLENKLKSTERQGKKTGNSLREMGSAYGGALAGLVSIGLATSLVKTTAKFQSLANSIKFASDNSVQGELSMQWISDMSKKYGLSLESTAEGFKTFQGALMKTKFSSNQVRKMFEQVSMGATAMGLSAEDTKGAFLALGQIMGKGKVQAEELRGQIGERIPGAFAIAARSMGVTTAKLDDMMKAGELAATDFLPKFAAEMEKTFGAGAIDSMNSLQASVSRFSNAWLELQLAISSSDGGIMQKTIDGWAKGLDWVADKFRDINQLSERSSSENTLNILGNMESHLKNQMELMQKNKSSKEDIEKGLRGTETMTLGNWGKNIKQLEAQLEAMRSANVEKETSGFFAVTQKEAASRSTVEEMYANDEEFKRVYDQLTSMKKASMGLQGINDKLISSLYEKPNKTEAGADGKLKSEISKVSSNQPSNVYINIDTLVKVDNIGISNASNPKSDMGTFLTQLEEALLTVVNDVNYVLK